MDRLPASNPNSLSPITHDPSPTVLPLQDAAFIRLDRRFDLGAGRAQEIPRHRVLERLRGGRKGQGASGVVRVGDVPGDEAPGEGVTSTQPVDDFDLSPWALHRLPILSHGHRAETHRPAGFAPLAGEGRHRQTELGASGVQHLGVLTVDVEKGAQHAAGREQDVDEGHDLDEAGARLRLAPELRAVVEVDGDERAGLARVTVRLRAVTEAL